MIQIGLSRAMALGTLSVKLHGVRALGSSSYHHECMGQAMIPHSVYFWIEVLFVETFVHTATP